MRGARWSTVDGFSTLPAHALVADKPKGLADLDRLESVFKALAHPSRRHILTVLRARGGTMSAGQLADRFDCTWPTTTRHLKLLVEADLISVTRTGRQRLYTINTETLGSVAGDWIDRFRQDTSLIAEPAEAR